MVRLRVFLSTLVWVLPASRAKNSLLRALGHAVSRDARIGPNIALRVDMVAIGAGARIGACNVIKDLRALTLAPGATIDRFNLISAHPVYKRLYERGAILELGEAAKIISRHSIDCSAQVRIGAFASLAGHQTVILTHSVDLQRDAQSAHPVEIGERSFVGTHCVILGGAVLPPRSVLAAGSLLGRARDVPEPGLWAGSPARHRQGVSGAWFERTGRDTSRVFDPSAERTIEDAL